MEDDEDRPRRVDPEQGEGTRLVDYVHRVPVGVLLRLQVHVATAAISPASFIIDACAEAGVS